MVTTSIVA